MGMQIPQGKGYFGGGSGYPLHAEIVVAMYQCDVAIVSTNRRLTVHA